MRHLLRDRHTTMCGLLLKDLPADNVTVSTSRCNCRKCNDNEHIAATIDVATHLEMTRLQSEHREKVLKKDQN